MKEEGREEFRVQKTTESIVKIKLKGEKKFKRKMREIKSEAESLREEIEQLNIALEKEVELLQKLR